MVQEGLSTTEKFSRFCHKKGKFRTSSDLDDFTLGQARGIGGWQLNKLVLVLILLLKELMLVLSGPIELLISAHDKD